MSLKAKKDLADTALGSALQALKSIPTFYLDELLPGKKASVKLIKVIEKLENLYGQVYYAKVTEETR